jgi:hypothetical protein
MPTDTQLSQNYVPQNSATQFSTDPQIPAGNPTRQRDADRLWASRCQVAVLHRDFLDGWAEMLEL